MQPRASCVVHLGNGAAWRIAAAEREAVPVVETLAAVMRLPLEPLYGEQTIAEHKAPPRDLRVVIRDASQLRVPLSVDRDGPVVVPVLPSTSQAMHTIALTRIADTVALDNVHKGGLLVHGALAELNGRGIILAGAGTVGKSTASRRLPEPWRSLSDDATLIVRDREGDLLAHPWPTWSRLYDDGFGHSWDVGVSRPLDAIFFLSQTPVDKVSPIDHRAQATAMLMDCVTAVSLGMHHNLRGTKDRTLLGEQLANVETCVGDLPMYTLGLSVDGSFWLLMEPLLRTASHPGNEGRGGQYRVPGRQFVALHGTSMLPTLREPSLLEVAQPGGSPLRVGDVVCFRSGGIRVVHRIISMEPGGIRTQGDNCPERDPHLLTHNQILGRVIASYRGRTRRTVRGGSIGRGVARVARLRRVVGAAAGPHLHQAYLHLAQSGLCQATWSWLTPRTVRPRVVRFGDGLLGIDKVVLAGREIGRVDSLHQRWTAQRPFHLIADKWTTQDVRRAREEHDAMRREQ